MIADEALTAIEDVRENAEAECVQIVDGIVRPVPWDNWRNCANQLLESLKYIHSICEDKTIELPDDDYAKVTIDECIMEAERAMQKCKKMEGEANVPLEENEGLHEDIIFWLTRAANWTAIAVRMAEELRGYESLALTHPHLYQGKGALLEFDRLKEKMK